MQAQCNPVRHIEGDENSMEWVVPYGRGADACVANALIIPSIRRLNVLIRPPHGRTPGRRSAHEQGNGHACRHRYQLSPRRTLAWYVLTHRCWHEVPTFLRSMSV